MFLRSIKVKLNQLEKKIKVVNLLVEPSIMRDRMNRVNSFCELLAKLQNPDQYTMPSKPE